MFGKILFLLALSDTFRYSTDIHAESEVVMRMEPPDWVREMEMGEKKRRKRYLPLWLPLLGALLKLGLNSSSGSKRIAWSLKVSSNSGKMRMLCARLYLGVNS